MDITLTPDILEKLIQHAKDAYPSEACGLLVGRTAIDRFVSVKNISPDPRQYEMDPAELITVLRNLRQSGENLIAIFHSHPHGPGEPSKSDIERAYYPEVAHVIVSLAQPERPQALAFRIIGGEVLPVELHVIV
jgi:[CysO sulfur-carrier protein]-S-L-cysteine hydrolase